MSRPQSLNLRDVREVFRLLGEVRELSADVMAWRSHASERLSKLVNARVAVALEVKNGIVDLRASRPLQVIGATDVGWHSEQEREHFLRRLQSGRPTTPYAAAQLKMLSRGVLTTVCRQRLIDNRRWYGSEHFNAVRRAARVDDFIYSNLPIPALGGSHSLGLHRAVCDRRFQERDRQMVALFHEEIGRLWHRASQTDPFGSLPRRMRQTLEFLLAGASEKQVASKLGIARNTVHRYVGMLHQHFGAHSRGELLAHCQGLLQQSRFLPRLYLQQPG